MADGTTKSRRAARGGFTLVEILVVLAITVILMGVLLIPLSRSLDLSARASAKITGQDNVRAAMRALASDLNNAMEVYEPRPITLWGYNSWTVNRDTPTPTSNAVAEAYVTSGGVIAFRLPKMQYYDTANGHYVSAQDFASVTGVAIQGGQELFALDSCPVHPGAPVELRPVSPPQPSDLITAYFVGLKDPTQRDSNGSPLYQNPPYFGSSVLKDASFMNTYCVYRVQFSQVDQRQFLGNNQANPNYGKPDLRYANWNLANGQPNPNFFYDTTSVTDPATGLAKPAYQWWVDASHRVLNDEAADVVRWVENAGKYTPQLLVSFFTTPVPDEEAQPNRAGGSFVLNGGVLGNTGAPLEYDAQHGHWVNVTPSPTAPNLPVALDPLGDGRSLIHSSQLTGRAAFDGPHIRIFDATTTPASIAFDSATGVRNRMVAYDAVSGQVVTAVPRFDWNNRNDPYLANGYNAAIGSDGVNDYMVDLKNDKGVVDSNITQPLPSCFGDALTAFPTTRLVPGSEVLQLVTGRSSGNPQVVTLKRAGYAIPNTASPPPPSQGELAPDEYDIDYGSGLITLPNGPPLTTTTNGTSTPHPWSAVGPNKTDELIVKYSIQTNLPSDVVRVGYTTRELITVNMGTIQTTKKLRETLPYQVSEQIVVRNLKR